MYVIWRKRKREHYAGWGKVGDVRLTPIIVQSRRVDGKPKQQHIACLPSIIESDIEKGPVWFWDKTEEQLARMTNRIPPEEMEKIRAALEKVVPKPELEFAEERRAAVQTWRDGFTKAFGPRDDWAREANRKLNAFQESLKTAERCADCAQPLEAVYRERRRFGKGPMGGSRWTTGVLCKDCAGRTYRFRRLGPCKTCGRDVFMSSSIHARQPLCSTRCAQAHYREARKLSSK
jgi:hypothetical protein